MKKVSLCAIIGAAGLLSASAAYAFDGGTSSVAQGVNYNAQTQIGVNNIQGVVQGVTGGHIDSVNDLGQLRVFQDSSASSEGGRGRRGGEAESATALKISSQAFVVGSIVDSGNGGKGGNGKIDIKQIAKIDDPEVSVDADGGRRGWHGGGNAKVDDTTAVNVAANVAFAHGGNGGDGGKGGNIEMNTIGSGNWEIKNDTTSIAKSASLDLRNSPINVVVDSKHVDIDNNLGGRR
jgi:hypothetical protein